MFKKAPLLIREIFWKISTFALYLSVGWFVWGLWHSGLNSLTSLAGSVIPLTATLLLFWARRQTHHMVGGPIYRHGVQAYMIGQMRHT